MREYVAVPFSDVIEQETTDTSCNLKKCDLVVG